MADEGEETRREGDTFAPKFEPTTLRVVLCVKRDLGVANFAAFWFRMEGNDCPSSFDSIDVLFRQTDRDEIHRRIKG